MYLKRLTLKNIKCFDDATLSLPGEGGYAGWNVLLGVNSTGKSTVLQAAALALLGPVSGGRLLQQPASWVRQGQAFGEIQAEIAHNPELDYVSAGQQRRRSPYRARLIVSGHGRVELEDLELVQPQLALLPAVQKRLNAGPYSGRAGWFSTGYGPFRRLTGGGGEENLSILYGGGRDARHLTLFRESAALTNVERWLTDLHSRAVDPALPEPVKQAAQRDLDVTRELLRTLLPQGVVVEEVSSLGVTFRSPLGARVGLNQLSDGYRSFLALVIDLLKQLADSRSLGVTHDANGAPVIPAEGVVLIDEADTHLHPSWQRDLGFRLMRGLPQAPVHRHQPQPLSSPRPRAPTGCSWCAKDARGRGDDHPLRSFSARLASGSDPAQRPLRLGVHPRPRDRRLARRARRLDQPRGARRGGSGPARGRARALGRAFDRAWGHPRRARALPGDGRAGRGAPQAPAGRHAMMPLTRPPEEQALSAVTRADLYARHTEASRLPPRSPEIDAAWRRLHNTSTRDALVSALRAMSDDKCAYCECADPRDVEHFYPKSRHPERMFRWDNLLFVCKTCNLDKKERFPMDGAQPLLIEPSAEDPARFFSWDPSTGRPLVDNEPTRRRRAEETLKTLPRLKNQALAEERRQLRLVVLFLLTEVLEEAPRPPDVVSRLQTLFAPTQPWRSVLRQLVSEEPPPSPAPLRCEPSRDEPLPPW
jgi:uncharacterized protein (TIGR02646 family)